MARYKGKRNNLNDFFFSNFFPQAQPLVSSSIFSPSIFGQQQQPQPPAVTCAAPVSQCQKSRYRTLDGSCNNLQNPIWGLANQRYSRLLTAKYADGVSAPTVSVTGEDLPNSRLVSLVVFGEEDVPDPEFTLVNMQWGQIITHDMSMQAGGTQSSKIFITNKIEREKGCVLTRFSFSFVLLNRKTQHQMLYK